ncbi:MAG TPA: hypothetical protein VI386_31605 [Candidatus Sulfotelmatobacter sp.]
MLSPLVSLVLLFGQHGKAVTVPPVVLENSGNRHVAPADNPQPHAIDGPESDGGGSGSGGSGPHQNKPPLTK